MAGVFDIEMMGGGVGVFTEMMGEINNRKTKLIFGLKI